MLSFRMWPFRMMKTQDTWEAQLLPVALLPKVQLPRSTTTIPVGGA